MSQLGLLKQLVKECNHLWKQRIEVYGTPDDTTAPYFYPVQEGEHYALVPRNGNLIKLGTDEYGDTIYVFVPNEEYTHRRSLTFIRYDHEECSVQILAGYVQIFDLLAKAITNEQIFPS